MLPTAVNKPVGKFNSSTGIVWIQLMYYCDLVRMPSKITGNNSLERTFRNTCSSIPSATHPSWISFHNLTNCFDIFNGSCSFRSPRYPFVSVMTCPCFSIFFYGPPHCHFCWRYPVCKSISERITCRFQTLNTLSPVKHACFFYFHALLTLPRITLLGID